VSVCLSLCSVCVSVHLMMTVTMCCMLSGALESSFSVGDGDVKVSDENTDSRQVSQERAQQHDAAVKVVVDDVDSVKAAAAAEDDDDDDDDGRGRVMTVKEVTCSSAGTVLDQSTL